MSWVSFREGIAQAIPVIERDHPGFFQWIFPGFGLLDALKTPILAFPYRTFGLPLSEVLRLSVRQIFTEAAHAAIIRGNSLELLSQLSCRSIADDLPSWVPDLTQRPWFPINETLMVPNTERRLRKALFTFSDDLEKLTTLGLPLDEVGPETGRTIETNASYAPTALLSRFPGTFLTRKGHLGFRALLQDEDPTRTPYSGDLVTMISGVSTPLITRPVGNGLYSIICSAQIPELVANERSMEAGEDLKSLTFA
ncbi:hypothetical protein DM02DRAFT_654878 [Periconia macrospinosa]|uniref:Uncharacterized protein n=1 Tax=Periconia macrospinosa TaxID=97972 RepID=A0A2V1DS42_9PLEO|nr:hypothetical protein DM02DRAFT_654878 [Periconia macrospinosa]